MLSTMQIKRDSFSVDFQSIRIDERKEKTGMPQHESGQSDISRIPTTSTRQGHSTLCVALPSCVNAAAVLMLPQC